MSHDYINISIENIMLKGNKINSHLKKLFKRKKL